MKKNFLVLVFGVFVSDISEVGFWPFWPTSSGPRPKLLDGSVLLKFSLA